ncbi:hypothetical protein P3T29_006263 [Kitasatospora sp. MAP5-34]|nr:hypothetical protein [Kitasatospora sp. MAP5-34]MDH6580571.1 hypothetical protein [Kitasatospora sp. MAP5-34]
MHALTLLPGALRHRNHDGARQLAKHAFTQS